MNAVEAVRRYFYDEAHVDHFRSIAQSRPPKANPHCEESEAARKGDISDITADGGILLSRTRSGPRPFQSQKLTGAIAPPNQRRSGSTHAPSSCRPLFICRFLGMSLDNGYAAIVSQANSMLWVGEFDEIGWTWRNAGLLYEFPRADNGTLRYGNIERVGWITRNRIVAVWTGGRKDPPDKNLSEKDQSIHILDIPS